MPLLCLLPIGLLLTSCSSGTAGDAAGPPAAGAATAAAPSATPVTGTSASPAASPAWEAAKGASSCDRQQVPGHEGREVRVGGLDCAAARAVILDAVGKGRAPYDSGGLSCPPTDAPDGQTDYACTGQGGRRLTFRYGAA